MNLKNLSVKNKAYKKIISHLNDKKILKVFQKLSNSLEVKENMAVAVSGGPDSLALAFLVKCYALKNKIKMKCFLVDHKLRKD